MHLLLTIMTLILILSFVDLSVPQNVELGANDSYTVYITWNVAYELNGTTIGYTIDWSIDGRKQKRIRLSAGQFYAFTEFKPQATLSASICAPYKPDALMNSEKNRFFH